MDQIKSHAKPLERASSSSELSESEKHQAGGAPGSWWVGERRAENTHSAARAFDNISTFTLSGSSQSDTHVVAAAAVDAEMKWKSY
jgi:hypothetical protein